MGVNNSRASLPTNLLEAMSSQEEWRLSVEKLAKLLDLDLVDLYRRIYENPRGISLSAATDGFGREEVGQLVTLLEEVGYPRAAEELYRAGVFVPQEAGARLQERLIVDYARAVGERFSELSSSSEAQRIRHELSRGLDYREVARRILAEQLPIEEVAEAVTQRFIREEELPSRGRGTLLEYIGMLRRRNILSYPVLGAGFYEQLYRLAVDEGFIKPRVRESYFSDREQRRRERDGSRGAGGAGSREGEAWARTLLGVPAGAKRLEIRRAYRKAMLRYHPDVNPRGGEVARELNAAYATLLGSIGYSS